MSAKEIKALDSIVSTNKGSQFIQFDLNSPGSPIASEELFEDEEIPYQAPRSLLKLKKRCAKKRARYYSEDSDSSNSDTLKQVSKRAMSVDEIEQVTQLTAYKVLRALRNDALKRQTKKLRFMRKNIELCN